MRNSWIENLCSYIFQYTIPGIQGSFLTCFSSKDNNLDLDETIVEGEQNIFYEKKFDVQKKKKLTCNSPSTMKQPLTSGIYMLLLLTWKNDSIIILLKWISLSTKTLIDVTKVFYYIVGYKTFVLIFLVHTFSWWFSWNRNRWSYLTDWRIPEV